MPDPRDARVAPPVGSNDPPSHVTVYRPADRPMMRIRINGVWQAATVHARHDRADGLAYQVAHTLPDPRGGQTTFTEVYYWDPHAMRPLPHTQPHPPWS